MRKIWNYISNLGMTADNRQLSERTLVLTNQLNFVMFFTLFILLVITIPLMLLTHDPIYIGTFRVVALLFVVLINLVIAQYGFTQLSRLSLIFLSPVVFILVPTIIFRYVEEESYVYYPFVIISASIIPQMLVHPKKEKILFWLSISFYFVLTVIIDKVMIHFGSKDFKIISIISTFYPLYKISQIVLFLFVNASIYYLRILNFRFEEELNKKNEELNLQNVELKDQKEKIEKQKDELITKEINTWQKLVSIITHEIVNSAIPITNLAGMTGQMLEDESGAVLKPDEIDEGTTEDIHHGLKIIESRTQALIDFVKATKSISQIPTPNIRKFNLKELFDRITILYKMKFKESGIRLEKYIIPEDLSIEADLELIEQVLINLIQNAMEAMQETSNPKLVINAIKNKADQVQISVSDNGISISDDVLEKIFLPFFSTKNNKSGIGLSLSQQIMKLHKGRIDVTSEPDRGTTFTLIL
jgi:signal transduction histidine kinase